MSDRPKILLVARAVIRRDGKILLLKKSKDASYEPGYWEIPGGKFDLGQSVPEVVQREVKEETGLDIEKGVGDLFTFTEAEAATGKYEGYHLLTLVFDVKSFNGKLRLSSEHDDSKWVALEGALDLKLTEATRKVLNFLTKR